MASDLEKRAKEAFFDDNYELAVDLYSQALDMDSKNADLFADRAQANIKLQNYTEAVADANRAIKLDPSMSKAYLRKGTACIKLEEYQTAKDALKAGADLTPGDLRFTNLIKECDDRIAEETNDLPRKVADVDPSCTSSPSAGSLLSNLAAGNGKESGACHDTSDQSLVVTSSRPKYRHDYYETPTEIVVTIFAKGISAKNVEVEFGEQILSVTIDVPGEDAYHFRPRLFGKIISEKCRSQVLSTKVEIRLCKADAVNWNCLEFNKDNVVPQKICAAPGRRSSQALVSASQPRSNLQPSTREMNSLPSQPLRAPATQRPTYPSSKPKTIDWDKLEAQVKKEEKEEKLDGDEGLNRLFRGIYQDADEDTRRAMMKSFVESNGTVLSTNWKEVGSKKVEGSPPEGMEMKKW